MTRAVLTASEHVRALEELLRMIHHLSPPLNQRPGLFLEQKDALGCYVLDLIRTLGGAVTTPTSFSTRQADTGASHVRVGGRAIPIERRAR